MLALKTYATTLGLVVSREVKNHVPAGQKTVSESFCAVHSRAERGRLGLEGQIQALMQLLGQAGTPI